MWAAMALGVLGIVIASYAIADPPDADWPGAGFVLASLIVWQIFIFVVCAGLTEWRSKQREEQDDLARNFE